MTVGATDHPGFKQTTVENWLEPDPLMAALVNLDHTTGLVTPSQGTDWIGFVNDLEIATAVPREVREAFRFATGAVGYAYFYYPMFTIVSQQVLRHRQTLRCAWHEKAAFLQAAARDSHKGGPLERS